MSASVDATIETQRERFYRVIGELLTEHDTLALVLAEIGAGYLSPALPAPVRDRVLNVGIREQLLIGTAAGLALSGMRPVVHTFAPFLIERPFEQIKLDLGHQDVGAVLVSAGGSYGWPEGGETHFGPRDVALLDTLDGWTVHVPGHPDEAETLLRLAVAGAGRHYLRLHDASGDAGSHAGTNAAAHEVTAGELIRIRNGSRGTVIAVGPMLDRVLAATQHLDLTVAYTATVRPFDAGGLLGMVGSGANGADVVIVEPYLRGTSAHAVSDALAHRAHRLLSLGVSRVEQRRYGTVADHDRLHRLDIAGLRADIEAFLAAAGAEQRR